jgi:hypothetical protein
MSAGQLRRSAAREDDPESAVHATPLTVRLSATDEHFSRLATADEHMSIDACPQLSRCRTHSITDSDMAYSPTAVDVVAAIAVHGQQRRGL